MRARLSIAALRTTFYALASYALASQSHAAIRDGLGPPSLPERGSPEPPMGLSLAQRLLLWTFSVGCLALLTLVVGFFAFVGSLERFERFPSGRADGIVVLTGGSQRIEDAIDLLARGYGERLLITGVNEKTSREVIARLNPGQRDLVKCCVDLDYRARNTIGNAVETRRWLRDNNFRSFIVVTSTYHMPRTLAELDHAIPSARKVPFAVVTESGDPDAWWTNPATARLLVAEYVKFLAVWLRTRVESDPESTTASRMGAPVHRLAGLRPVRPVSERSEIR